LLLLTSCGRAYSDDLVGSGQHHRRRYARIHRTRVRLWGVDAPERTQLCRGEDSLQYRCGARAANDLDAFIAGRGQLFRQNQYDTYFVLQNVRRDDGNVKEKRSSISAAASSSLAKT
jgi:hypothetical protein